MKNIEHDQFDCGVQPSFLPPVVSEKNNEEKPVVEEKFKVEVKKIKDDIYNKLPSRFTRY